MAIQVVQLGTDRRKNEGIRIGTVRRPPRGVKKDNFATQNWYDLWLPEVAPSAELLKEAQQAETDKEWKRFITKYRKELSSPDKSRLLKLLAAFSLGSDFSIGCYCETTDHCHISILCTALEEHGAVFKDQK